MMLTPPTILSSLNGTLHTSIHLIAATHTVEANLGLGSPAFALTTRTLNGTLPGPALFLKAGDTLIVDFYNDLLEDDNSKHKFNKFSASSESNLHFHGLHVSGELPSDDSAYVVGPGQSYRYIAQIPDDHVPGINWYHPHRHGSTTLQVGGGAFGAIVVEDDVKDSVLPSVILEAPQALLMLHEMQLKKMQNVASSSGDSVFNVQVLDELEASGLDITTEKFYTVNGQINPSVPLVPGQWMRLRMIHIGVFQGWFGLAIEGCEIQLIAKDGVYLPVLPRKTKIIKLMNGGRADMMVQCPFTDGVQEYKLQRVQDNNHDHVWEEEGPRIVTFVRDDTTSSNSTTSAEPIPSTQMEFPSYLQDLRNTPPTPGCSCETNLKFGHIRYKEGAYFHESFEGAVVERLLVSGGHPYHQHVRPYQIIAGEDSTEHDDGYFHIGDWHDTLDGTHTVRYIASQYTGKMMIHCHKLDHEDKGQMSTEYVHPRSDANQCVCGKPPPSMPTWAIVLICLGGFLSLLLIGGGGVWYWRRRQSGANDPMLIEDSEKKRMTSDDDRGEEGVPQPQRNAVEEVLACA